MNKGKLTLFGGHAVECFDNTLYGFFAVMLAPIYFPSTESEHIALLGSYGAFAAGYLARPLGAVCFGLWGDRQGRHKPLLWSMAFVGFPTAIIGCLPGYEVLGMISPVLLISCRLLQGFFIGAEFAGANLYLIENNYGNTLGSQTGKLVATGCMGATVATIIGALFSMEGMPSWAWRIPFIFGGFSALTMYFLRRNLPETNDFARAQRDRQLLRYPWKVLLKNYKSSLLLAMLIGGLSAVPLYAATIFANQIFREQGFTTSQSLLLNTAAMIILSIAVFYSGRMADKIGFQNQMLLGTCLTVIMPIPAFMLIGGTHITTMNVLIFVGSMTTSGAIISGCATPYIAQFFPINCRYSAIAVSDTVGSALLAGMTPLICLYLKGTFQSNLAPAFWVSSVSLITAIGIYLAGRRDKKLQTTSHLVHNQDLASVPQ